MSFSKSMRNKRTSDVFLNNNYLNNQQSLVFHKLVQELNQRNVHCKRLLAILKAIDAMPPTSKQEFDFEVVLETYLKNFIWWRINLKDAIMVEKH